MTEQMEIFHGILAVAHGIAFLIVGAMVVGLVRDELKRRRPRR
jgi:hypothetical protein